MHYAKAVLEENNRLKETLTWGEKALIEQAQQKLVYDTVIAEAQYKEPTKRTILKHLLQRKENFIVFRLKQSN